MEMKHFHCGDVVAGCGAEFWAAGDDEILRQVGEHAMADHGLTEITAALAAAVSAHIGVVAV
jgi:predicted small metal-binding protein